MSARPLVSVIVPTHNRVESLLRTLAAFERQTFDRHEMELIVVADGALVLRALFEERMLLADTRYREYCQRVGWHLVPGVF